MKDFFEQLFGPNAQGETNAYGSNPSTLSLAGLMAATSGKRLGDVMTDAAAVNRDREMTRLNKMKQEQEANQIIAQQKLGQWMQENPRANNQQIVQKANELGLPFANIASLVSSIGNEEKLVEDKIYGEEPKILSKQGGRITGLTPTSQALGSAGSGGEMPVFAPNTPNMTSLPAPSNSTEGGKVNAKSSPKEMVSNFINESDKYAPKVRQTLNEKLVDKKAFNEFRKDVIQPTNDVVRSTRLALNVLTNAAQTFKTGTAGEQRLAAKSLGNFLGIKNAEEVGSGELIRTAANELSIKLAEKMKPVSDSDRKHFLTVVPSLSTSPEGIKKLAEYFDKINDRIEMYNTAAEKYYLKHRTLEGFETAWTEFANTNSLFAGETPQSNGTNLSEKFKNASRQDIERALANKRNQGAK
jgi:hypothetical protein